MSTQLTPGAAWFEEFRPRNVEDVVFSNEGDKNTVMSWVQNEAIDGNVLLSGAAGTGKTTLALILIRLIIKTQNDLNVVNSRSVKDIDKLVPWLRGKPQKSKKKIVYIEEMDRLSPQAQGQLKDGPMEKQQDYVSFICCTNWPKRLDYALLDRFTYHIEFKSDFVDGKAQRMEYILNAKQAKYNPQELKDFVEANYKKSFRALISALQRSYVRNQGSIDFTEIQSGLNIEEDIVGLIIKMMKDIMRNPDMKARKTCFLQPLNSQIGTDYETFVKLVHNNYDINYGAILERLYDLVSYLPLKLIISKYAEEIEMKKYPNFHIVGLFYEMMQCISEMTL